MLYRNNRFFASVLLSVVTCLLLVTTSFASVTSKQSAQTNQVQDLSIGSLIEQRVESHLQEAESVLLAQTSGESTPMTRYVVVMQGKNVVPSSVSTFAFSAAGATLVGDRLVVRGDYSNLSSALRDYATDPLNPPNPKITSGIHIHQGTPDKNGPFQYPLTVQPKEKGNAGRFAGEYTLTAEQVQALSGGTMYMDIHTKQNRGGELRGIFKPYVKAEPK
jgi:hypothetical protein